MHNHEVFYTSDLDDIFDMYPNLSKEYLRKLYNKEKQKIDF